MASSMAIKMPEAFQQSPNCAIDNALRNSYLHTKRNLFKRDGYEEIWLYLLIGTSYIRSLLYSCSYLMHKVRLIITILLLTFLPDTLTEDYLAEFDDQTETKKFGDSAQASSARNYDVAISNQRSEGDSYTSSNDVIKLSAGISKHQPEVVASSVDLEPLEPLPIVPKISASGCGDDDGERSSKGGANAPSVAPSGCGSPSKSCGSCGSPVITTQPCQPQSQPYFSQVKIKIIRMNPWF